MFSKKISKATSFVCLFGLMFGSLVPQSFAIPYPIDGTFSALRVQTEQTAQAETKATLTIRFDNGAGVLPMSPASTLCPSSLNYDYAVTSIDATYGITLRNCPSSSIIQSSASTALFINEYDQSFASYIPSEIVNAIAGLGTIFNGAYSVSSNGNSLTLTRTATETDPNGSNISYFDSSNPYSGVLGFSTTPGYAARDSQVAIYDLIPENPNSGEVFKATINSTEYTATGETESELITNFITAYTTNPLSDISCTDEITKITCSGTNYTTSLDITTEVIYPGPDTTAPYVYFYDSADSEVSVEFGSTFTDTGALWIDNRDGKGSILTASSGSVDTNTLGDYTLTYTYQDIAGNTGSIDKVVHVVDATAPILTLNGSSTVTQELDEVFSDDGADWTDNYDGNGTVYGENTTFTSTGTTTVTYTYIDTSGNTGSIDRTVNVVDTIAPTLSLSSTPTTFNANKFLIRGNAPTATYIQVTGGSTSPFTGAIDEYGEFDFLVPLTQNATNTLVITVTDDNGNSSSGTIIVIENSSLDAFTGATNFDPSDIGLYSTVTGTGATEATKITIESPLVLDTKGGASATLPAGLEIVRPNGDAFNATELATDIVDVSGELNNAEISRGALEFGISNTPLHFSKPIKIQIPITGYSGTSIPVKVKHAGTTTYTTSGLTTNPNSTCTNGISSNPGSTAPISGGFATIYTCAASTFTTIETTSSGGGGGGGGGGASSTVNTVSNPVVTNLTETTNTEQETEPVTEVTETMEETVTLEDIIPENLIPETNEMPEILSNPIRQSYIEKLIELGAVDTTLAKFIPEQPITRAEFLKILFNVIGEDYETVDTERDYFTDLVSSEWTAKIAYKAYDMGLSAGYTDRTFRPNTYITRIEAIKFILKLPQVEILETTETEFVDVTEDWMKKYVNKAKELEIISGQVSPNGLIFRPLDFITRGESAKVIVKILPNGH